MQAQCALIQWIGLPKDRMYLPDRRPRLKEIHPPHNMLLWFRMAQQRAAWHLFLESVRDPVDIFEFIEQDQGEESKEGDAPELVLDEAPPLWEWRELGLHAEGLSASHQGWSRGEKESSKKEWMRDTGNNEHCAE